MNVIDALQHRRSIKEFNRYTKIPEHIFNKIIQAAMLSPSAFNLQHWRVARVTDQTLRENIYQISNQQPQVVTASELLVLCAKRNDWQQPDRFYEGVPEATKSIIFPKIHDYYHNKPKIERDECMRSCGLFAMSLMLAATSEGYDSCAMDGFDYEAMASLLKLPKSYVVTMMVAIGVASKKPFERIGKMSIKDVLINNYFYNKDKQA